jgi:hypothetical protein
MEAGRFCYAQLRTEKGLTSRSSELPLVATLPAAGSSLWVTLFSDHEQRTPNLE